MNSHTFKRRFASASNSSQTLTNSAPAPHNMRRIVTFSFAVS